MEEEIESESEGIKYEMEEDIKEEVKSEDKNSEDKLKDTEESIGMHVGWCCFFFIKVHRKWFFVWNWHDKAKKMNLGDKVWGDEMKTREC